MEEDIEKLARKLAETRVFEEILYVEGKDISNVLDIFSKDIRFTEYAEELYKEFYSYYYNMIKKEYANKSTIIKTTVS